MSSADDLVKGALYAIGAHSEINPADPSLLELARKKLIAMIREDIGVAMFYGSRLTELTNAGLTATGTLDGHDLDSGDAIHVGGAHDPDFNGYFDVLAAPSAATFTYTIAEGEATGETQPQYDALGMRVIHLPEAIGDNVLEDGAASEALMMRLAVRMAPSCRKAVPADVRGAAVRGLATLRALFQKPVIQNIVPSSLLPRGQGSTRGKFGRTFMGGSELADDVPTTSDVVTEPINLDGGGP